MPLPPALPLSVVLIAYNEADRIAPALHAIQGANEVLVVDSLSQDGTPQLCQQYGARVLNRPFTDFSSQKQFGIDAALHDWILLLDADEVPDETLLASIEALFQAGEPALAGYHLPRSLVFLGRHFRHGKEHAQPQLRLFDRRRGRMSGDIVHEGWQTEGPVGVLTGELLHNSYRNLSDYLTKFNRYTSLAAEQLFARGKTRNRLYTLFTLPLYFWKHYLLYGNWRNGYPGLVWSLLSAFYPVVKYWKVEELRSRN